MRSVWSYQYMLDKHLPGARFETNDMTPYIAIGKKYYWVGDAPVESSKQRMEEYIFDACRELESGNERRHERVPEFGFFGAERPEWRW